MAQQFIDTSDQLLESHMIDNALDHAAHDQLGPYLNVNGYPPGFVAQGPSISHGLHPNLALVTTHHYTLPTLPTDIHQLSDSIVADLAQPPTQTQQNQQWGQEGEAGLDLQLQPEMEVYSARSRDGRPYRHKIPKQSEACHQHELDVKRTTLGQRPAGTIREIPTRDTLARLPFELQARVFELASEERQTIYLEADLQDGLCLSTPGQTGLAAACRLSRCCYLKAGRVLLELQSRWIWVNPSVDLFYLRHDGWPGKTFRPKVAFTLFNFMVRNIAVDLEYLGGHPRREALGRLWDLFPSMTQLNIFVPDGPPGTQTPISNPSTLILKDLPNTKVVAPPHQDNELWAAIRWQVRRAFIKMVHSEFYGRVPVHDVQGYLISVQNSEAEDVTSRKDGNASALGWFFQMASSF